MILPRCLIHRIRSTERNARIRNGCTWAMIAIVVHGWFSATTALAGHESDDVAAQAMARRIDWHINRSLEVRGLSPSERCDDADFLRRVRLDLTGVIPSVAEVRSFLNDASSNKRAQLVNRSLGSPQHPTHLANVWRRILLPDDLELSQRQQAIDLQNWLRKQFVKNLRYDRFVAAFLSATGTDGAGPAVFYQSHELKPEKLASATSRIFLGVQIQCAECHDHPFDDWTQHDFWGYAAFFAQMQNNGGAMGRSMQLVDLDRGEVTIPDTEEIVAPKFPTDSSARSLQRGTRRRQLAIWMASRDNPFLPVAAVNRVWAEMFGRGLVEPVDDLGPHNPASHPELMDELSDFLVAQQFDLRQLYRAIALSDAYQRTSELPRVNDQQGTTEPIAYERMAVRTLSAEQLFDSLSRSLAIDTSSSQSRDFARIQFVNSMRSNSSSPVAYDLGVQQALRMMNGPLTALGTGVNADDEGAPSEAEAPETPEAAARMAAVAMRPGILASLDAPFWSDNQRLETLFLATLSRRPTDTESERLVVYMNRETGRSDLLWALLNSAEYQFVR